MKNIAAISFALAHVLKSAVRLTALGRAGDVETTKSFASGPRRRTELIEHLSRAYKVEHDNSCAASHRGPILPADGWINQRLSELGEPWRVHSVDGYRYEVYETV